MVRIGLAAAVLLGVGLLGLNELGYPPAKVATDPNAVADQPWWTGALSQLGLIGWGIVVGGFAGAAWLRRAGGVPSKEWRFLAFTALLFAAIAVDDALMLHESALSRGEKGVQVGILAIWLIAGGAWAVSYRRQLLARPVLLAALGGLAASLLLDVTSMISDTTGAAVEDYMKYSGLTLLVLAAGIELGATARTVSRAPVAAGLN